MKKLGFLASVAIVTLGLISTSCNQGKSTSINTPVDTAAYAIGVINGEAFLQNLDNMPGEKMDVDKLLAGFRDAMSGDSAKIHITSEYARDFLNEYFMKAQLKEAEENKKIGDEFLAKNAKEKGVLTTESGLQYKIVEEGKGAKPTMDDKVKVHYTGYNLDGKIFDSSKNRNEPAVFGLRQVIKGWGEGLQLMPVGSKYIFWIPSDLAYGPQGMGGDIKPNSVLKFEVELIEIIKNEKK